MRWDALISIIKGECPRGLKISPNGTKTEARSESGAVSRGLRGSQGVSKGLKVAQGLGPKHLHGPQKVSKCHGAWALGTSGDLKGSQGATRPRPQAPPGISKGLKVPQGLGPKHF